MERKILIRGMMTEINTWITGCYFYSEKENKHYITGESKEYGFQKCEVISETVGQFTGLTDKNGKKIFEGDILKIESDKLMVVGWSKKFASFILDHDGWFFSHWFGESCDPESCEIIGNIHDNPELLTK
jgi:uncharacterized phage protein (TIGR01671 family)